MAIETVSLPFAFPLQLAGTPKRFDPVGRCIYCGEYSDKLELEHVMPFGIAGNMLLLPDSSCRACAKITGQVEQTCLRHLWWPFRTRIGAPTGSKPPRTFMLRRVKNEGGRAVLMGSSEVNAKEYPLNYVALLLPQPGILAGRPPTDMFEGQIWATYSTQELNQHIGAGEGMMMGPINPNIFARMLAKIAYAYEVGHRGYGSFNPLIVDFILGKTETANYWVGGELELPTTHEAGILHDLRGRRCTTPAGKTYRVVTIQLFSFLRSPVYHVVVAEL